MPLHADDAFAVLDLDLHLERIAGGNETEVYLTDDQRYVVKVKSSESEAVEVGLDVVFEYAANMRDAANSFAQAVGPEHSLANDFVVAQNSQGKPEILAVQPFLNGATALFDIDYRALTRRERKEIARQLHKIVAQSLKYYRRTSNMPDLYGRTSQSKAERKRLNQIHMLPWRLWSFIVERSLLRANNLMLVKDPDIRIVLVDYDTVNRSRLYKLVYYTARQVLFWRDYVLIRMMEATGFVPPASG